MFIPMKDYTDFTPFMIDVDYKEDAAPVQEVDDYIDSLTSKDPDYRMLLMEVIGFVMITDPERIRSLGKFFMFRGDGANGKGTLLQIMKRIYNPKNCTSLSIKQLVDDRFKVTMVGKLANLGDDIEAEAITHDELKVLKNISTADTVSTRKLYEESENATFTVKLYFTTNSDILSFDKGYAFKRRIQWLPMFNKVDKPDPYFITKMTTKPALEYWIRLIVEGYKRLYQNRKWTVCKVVEDYNNQYHEDNKSARPSPRSGWTSWNGQVMTGSSHQSSFRMLYGICTRSVWEGRNRTARREEYSCGRRIRAKSSIIEGFGKPYRNAP